MQGRNILVDACIGSGKTTAIQRLCDEFPRERNILYLRFQVGKTQVEVAEEIGISQAQVSRLEKGAVNKIKAGL